MTTLTSQVCNLDLSRRLKELGYPHTSLFDWCEIGDGEWMLMMRREKEHKEIMEQYPEHEGCISAPTASELGEILKQWTNYNEGHCWHVFWNGTQWGCADIRLDENHMEESQTNHFAPTLVDAMGEMVVYLADHGLITFNSK